MKITMTFISKRQRAHFYIYKKLEKCETLLYTKIQTLFKKQDNLRYVFIYKNPDLCVTRFLLNFRNWRRGEGIFIWKNNALFVTFLYANNNALCVTSLYANINSLCVTFYIQKS